MDWIQFAVLLVGIVTTNITLFAFMNKKNKNEVKDLTAHERRHTQAEERIEQLSAKITTLNNLLDTHFKEIKNEVEKIYELIRTKK